MSETKHTPGPWTVCCNENGTLGIDANKPDGTPCQPARIVTRANARLIAAAPDLLEALNQIESDLAMPPEPGLIVPIEREAAVKTVMAAKSWLAEMADATTCFCCPQLPPDGAAGE